MIPFIVQQLWLSQLIPINPMRYAPDSKHQNIHGVACCVHKPCGMKFYFSASGFSLGQCSISVLGGYVHSQFRKFKFRWYLAFDMWQSNRWSLRYGILLDSCRRRYKSLDRGQFEFQRKPIVSDPGMHHSTCVTHVPWMHAGITNIPTNPGACATRNFTYLVRCQGIECTNCIWLAYTA